MMSKATFRPLLSVATGAAVALVLHVLYQLPSAACQTLAAWVQAFGSILAIGIAYLVGAKQSRAAIDAVAATQRAAIETRRQGQFAVIQAARNHAEQIREAMVSEDPSFALLSVYNKIVTQRVAKALERIPVHEVGTEAGVRAILSMADQFLLLEVALETYIAGPWKHPEIGKTLEQYANDAVLREELLNTGTTVLASNVNVHLGQVARDYDVVRNAMSPEEAVSSSGS
jgi:hypothetical protein